MTSLEKIAAVFVRRLKTLPYEDARAILQFVEACLRSYQPVPLRKIVDEGGLRLYSSP